MTTSGRDGRPAGTGEQYEHLYCNKIRPAVNPGGGENVRRPGGGQNRTSNPAAVKWRSLVNARVIPGRRIAVKARWTGSWLVLVVAGGQLGVAQVERLSQYREDPPPVGLRLVRRVVRLVVVVGHKDVPAG